MENNETNEEDTHIFWIVLGVILGAAGIVFAQQFPMFEYTPRTQKILIEEKTISKELETCKQRGAGYLQFVVEAENPNAKVYGVECLTDLSKE